MLIHILLVLSFPLVSSCVPGAFDGGWSLALFVPSACRDSQLYVPSRCRLYMCTSPCAKGALSLHRLQSPVWKSSASSAVLKATYAVNPPLLTGMLWLPWLTLPSTISFTLQFSLRISTTRSIAMPLGGYLHPISYL